jgi:ParB-like chromosome segregation protein Spo0J
MTTPTLFDSIVATIEAQAQALAKEIAMLPLIERIEAINRAKLVLHAVSPFEDEPVDCVLWVRNETMQGNDYNPNTVASPEMKLLERSIDKDGYTQPIVTFETEDGHEVVDGFHRMRIGKESAKIRKRVHGYLPVAVINQHRTDRKDRVAATIRHNRARGVHGVLPMTSIVANLLKLGWADEDVAKELGMDADELLRFKQTTGLPELFKNQPYSRAWK